MLDPFVMAQLRMPAAFLAQLQAALVPGTSVLVTSAPVLPQHNNGGRRLTVLAASGD
ncbi:hypothetical protein GVO57_05965 [Sphingomonas changnyeongensis]|uniref:Uncharacterized protein n=1 Tax=Sphingomonas changnyeongensis TaxID=2698679 RepID=A0A7Z2S8A5_9SPHN|nr:hypothetical protein [Sphingomonas changnyeongensis]QHL90462.1 hypothetical protein GVO57_05965 [Sphingomonas changnyeongensis]